MEVASANDGKPTPCSASEKVANEPPPTTTASASSVPPTSLVIPTNPNDGATPLMQALGTKGFDEAIQLLDKVAAIGKGEAPPADADGTDADYTHANNNSTSDVSIPRVTCVTPAAYPSAYLNVMNYRSETALTIALAMGAPVALIERLLAMGADAKVATRDAGTMLHHVSAYGTGQRSNRTAMTTGRNLPSTFHFVTCPTQQCYYGHPMTTGNYGDSGLSWSCDDCQASCSYDVAMQCRICHYDRCLGCVAKQCNIPYRGTTLGYNGRDHTRPGWYTFAQRAVPAAEKVCDRCHEATHRNGFICTPTDVAVTAPTDNGDSPPVECGEPKPMEGAAEVFVCAPCGLELYNQQPSPVVMKGKSRDGNTAMTPERLIGGITGANRYLGVVPPKPNNSPDLPTIARMLLAAGVPVGSFDMDGRMPIHRAIDVNNLALVRFFMEEAGVRAEPIHVAEDGSWGSDNADGGESEEGLWWDARGGIRQMPLLYYAVLTGASEIIDYLITAHGSDVNGGPFGAKYGTPLRLFAKVAVPSYSMPGTASTQCLLDHGALAEVSVVWTAYTVGHNPYGRRQTKFMATVLDCGADVTPNPVPLDADEATTTSAVTDADTIVQLHLRGAHDPLLPLELQEAGIEKPVPARTIPPVGDGNRSGSEDTSYNEEDVDGSSYGSDMDEDHYDYIDGGDGDSTIMLA